MGFGAAVAGGIIITVILVIAGLTMSTLLRTNESIVRASNERNMIESDYANTAIKVTSVQVMSSNGTVLLSLQNTGSTKRWNFENFDVIMQYSSMVNVGNSTTLQHHAEKLFYKGITNSLPSGSWGISSFQGDNYDPLILNPDENMEIKCVLGNTVASNSSLIATIVTDNGVKTTKFVEVA
jgi:archaellum component FlaF (FlaF/FlaG flagellin family)